MPVRTAYEYSCQFCNVVQNIYASLQIANKAVSAASDGDHKRAKAIILNYRIWKDRMMFLASLINAKVHIISGIAIGVGMTMVCREMCKKKGQLATRYAAEKHETSD